VAAAAALEFGQKEAERVAAAATADRTAHELEQELKDAEAWAICSPGLGDTCESPENWLGSPGKENAWNSKLVVC
jgi:hypothetical protein